MEIKARRAFDAVLPFLGFAVFFRQMADIPDEVDNSALFPASSKRTENSQILIKNS
jgi:hypothetical protein